MSRRTVALGLAAASALLTPGHAGAVVDYPVRLPLPDGDVAVGASGGVVFGEERRGASTSGVGGVDVGWLDGLFGVHAGLRLHREGFDTRLTGLVEVTWWYLLLLGTGVSYGQMLGDGGPGVEDDVVGLTLLVAAPFPVLRLDEGQGGSLVLMPYVRPGLRFRDERPGLDRDDRLEGFHEVGLSLRWTTFGW